MTVDLVKEISPAGLGNNTVAICDFRRVNRVADAINDSGRG